MPLPYGTQPAKGHKQQTAPQAVEVQVNITGRHTMEQLALEVQRALAMVQDYGASGLEKFRFRLLPLDMDGDPMVLRDEQDRPVLIINIPDVTATPVYRENEPGVGIRPLSAAQPRSAKTPNNAARISSG